MVISVDYVKIRLVRISKNQILISAYHYELSATEFIKPGVCLVSKIAFVREASIHVCVCLLLRLLITNYMV